MIRLPTPLGRGEGPNFTTQLCHELKMPIGVMAFQGLQPLVPSIEALLTHPKAVASVAKHLGHCH